MQNKAERYQNGKIYAIRSNETDEVYIGSTCSSLPKRLFEHRMGLKRYKNTGCLYYTSFKILEYADHYIELIEMYPCNSKAELERREGEIMREHATRVNKHLAGRTEVEWRDDNKDEIRQKKKEFREANKDKIAIVKKRHVELNREHYREYIKKWSEAHKEERSKKIICECGSELTQGSKLRHIKTDKHKAYVAAQ